MVTLSNVSYRVRHPIVTVTLVGTDANTDITVSENRTKDSVTSRKG